MEYLKKHKEVIIIVAGTTVLGIVGYSIYKTQHPPKFSELIIPPTDRVKDFASMEIGEVTAAWDESGFTNIILNDVPMEDIGKVGEELLKFMPDTKEAYLMVGIKNTVD